jgi:uncharacterized protein YndB with AHSA1/START domain
MSASAQSAYGTMIEPATLRIRRVLPGPIDRVWSYLTDGELRRTWLAAGKMDLRPGTEFELVWRNDELTTPAGARPKDFGDEHRMTSRIVAVEAPRLLVFTWGPRGEVAFDLEEDGEDVVLTVIHRRISDRPNTLMVGAGWHMHLDVLASRLSGTETEPFWDGWMRLRQEYDRRLPAAT